MAPFNCRFYCKSKVLTEIETNTFKVKTKLSIILKLFIITQITNLGNNKLNNQKL